MESTLALIAALGLFLFGLRLSGFFSGVETGFYRVSFLRLSIDAHAGDRLADRILWFVQNPSYFVATTLVGNNVANYITTLAIGLAVVTIFQDATDWLKIVGTLMFSPVIFVFGELIPKNLYYRAPLSLLRKDALRFHFFYRLFLFVSFPLIWVTKLFERFGRSDKQQLELVLGRNRLVQVLGHGHREGLLSDIQSRLVDGLMHTAAQPVADSITPTSRVLGLPEDVTREEVLDYARRFGVSHVAIKRSHSTDDWFGYLRVVDVAVDRRPLKDLIHIMPRIDASFSKLQTLLELRSAGKTYGVVRRGEMVLGIVSARGLAEHLFRPAQAVGARLPAAS